MTTTTKMFTRFFPAVLLQIGLLGVPSVSIAIPDSEVERLLKWFDSSPQSFMARDPSTNKLLSTPGPLIGANSLSAKNESRDAILEASQAAESGSDHEKIEDLLDPTEMIGTNGRILRGLNEMEKFGFQEFTLANDVWSGPAWPIYRGSTAVRYNIAKAREASSWRSAWAFVSSMGHTLHEVALGKSTDILLDDLGPTEKYDLLFHSPTDGDPAMLSRYDWDQGAKKQKEKGKVPKWNGYCHGWAAASYMMARPERAVIVASADQSTQIKFYPSDVKALQTELWANNPPLIRLVGTRCDIAKPKRDENGRVISEECFDVNPGIFHMAVVNQLASARRNLIMDATYDLQIWNQPIISYKYKYFNPQTSKVGTLAASSVARGDLKKDKFARYRAPDAVMIVGISIDVVYGLGSQASHLETDSAALDKTKTVHYMYDLEINASGEIIGGEWYGTRHPDFIWTPVTGARAVSDFDKDIVEPWVQGQAVPLSWREPAQKAGIVGQPLAAVVETLLALSRASQ